MLSRRAALKRLGSATAIAASSAIASTPSMAAAASPPEETDAGAREPPPAPTKVVPPAPNLAAVNYTTPRYEVAGFPTFGGDTDIGAQVGLAGSLTRFGYDVRPYVWHLNVVVSASFKNDPGFDFVQQTYFAALDVPQIGGTSVRLLPATGFVRTIDAPYFGLGNGPKPPLPAGANPATYDQFVAQTFFLREITRIVFHKPYELVFEPTLRYAAPRDYAGSLLASNAAADGADGAPAVHGLRDGPIVTLAAGMIVDSRDDELFPKRGVFLQASLKYVLGFPADGDVSYGAACGNFAGFIHLGGESVLALRGVLDFDFGNVPFFDLYAGGPFRALQLPGGSTGVRGVPLGLYSGLVKVVGNVELRTLFVAFRVLRQKIRLGGDAFFDAGRAFADYSLDSPRDGSGIGIHWGVGGGLYFGWGDAALIRLEVAYSPDAFPLSLPFTSVGVPLGVYLQDGVMF